MFKFDEKLVNSISDNLLVKVYVYDTDLKCVPYKDKYDLVLNKDYKAYCEQHKSTLYDTQIFIKSNL